MKYDGIGEFFYDNGEKLPSESADVAFDKIDSYPFFEIIRVVDDVPIFMEAHISRLFESMEFLKYHNMPNKDELLFNLHRAIRDLEVGNQNVKLVIVDDDNEKRHVFVYPVKSKYPSEKNYKDGVYVSLFVHDRDTRSKFYSDIGFEEIGRHILRTGSFETLLMNSDAQIREGGRSNLFVVYDDKVHTSPADEIISTVNRELVLEIIRDLKFPLEYSSLGVRDLHGLKSAFIIGTTIGVLPVSKIEGINISSSKEPMTVAIMNEYGKRIDEFVKSKK